MKPSSPFRARSLQAWTIAKIELRRVFFAKRSFWIYGLALLPSLMFFGHGLDAKITGTVHALGSGGHYASRRPEVESC